MCNFIIMHVVLIKLNMVSKYFFYENSLKSNNLIKNYLNIHGILMIIYFNLLDVNYNNLK